MRGKPIKKNEIEQIVKLRQTGHSLPEICKVLNRGGSTVHKYAKDVAVFPECASSLKQKQGGSKRRSNEQWNKSLIKASELLRGVNKRDKLFILAALYWGEGTKSGFDIINGDPSLIKVVIACLKDIGVNEMDLRISLRIYDDVSLAKAKKYWAAVCGIPVKNILSVNVLHGKKTGKLVYGMCRVRIARSGETFKLIMSMIDVIKSKI